MPRIRLFVAVLLALSMLGLRAQLAVAATITDCPGTESALQTDVANAGNGGTVTLNCASATTITFTSAIHIAQNITITSIGRQVALSGGGTSQIFFVEAGNPTVTLTLNQLTLESGHAPFGGAIAVESPVSSSTGGELLSGTLNVSNSTFTGNSAGQGGAIDNYGTLNISNSTLSANTAAADSVPTGGAIDNEAASNYGVPIVNLVNSTLSGNSASLSGGAIENHGGVNINNSTLTGNSASQGGAIDNGQPLGAFSPQVDLAGTIIANSPSGGNCANHTSAYDSGIVDNGYNLSDDNGADCNLYDLSTDVLNTNPQLDPNGLQNNGGPTQTIALLPGSPAIDKIPTTYTPQGSANRLCSATDQRGVPRPDTNESACDIGAFEFYDPAAGVCPSSETALQSDITNAGPSNTVVLSCPSPTTISFTGAITVGQSMTLDASGSPGAITFNGGNSGRLIIVYSTGDFTMNGLTLAHAAANGDGGAILNSGLTSIINSTLSANSANHGGAVLNNGGTLHISGSTLTGNSAGSNGGAIDNTGKLSVVNSTFANNSAPQGTGGAITNEDTGTLSLTSSTITANSAGFGGAGVYNSAGRVTIGGSIIAANNGSDCVFFKAITDAGYNLDSGTSCGFAGTGDLQNTSPQLAPGGLQNNGGPTQTITLQSTSPAIDHIPTSSGLCPRTDQRGDTRPDGGETVCDIGAYESGASSPTFALVTRFTVRHLGASLLARWTLTRHAAVAGFLLYAGTHRLTRNPLPVHAASWYVYRTYDTTSAPVILRVLLTTGGTVDIHPGSVFQRTRT